jgi:hypothetical protein
MKAIPISYKTMGKLIKVIVSTFCLRYESVFHNLGTDCIATCKVYTAIAANPRGQIYIVMNMLHLI